MLKRLDKHRISLKHAFDGVIWCFKTQPNYQVHLVLSIIAVLAGLYLKISRTEFFVIILLITIGLVVETINTAIEQTTDAIDTSMRDDIKIAKDVAAGAMLIFAIGAFVISCIIYIPKIVDLVFY